MPPPIPPTPLGAEAAAAEAESEPEPAPVDEEEERLAVLSLLCSTNDFDAMLYSQRPQPQAVILRSMLGDQRLRLLVPLNERTRTRTHACIHSAAYTAASARQLHSAPEEPEPVRQVPDVRFKQKF